MNNTAADFDRWMAEQSGARTGSASRHHARISFFNKFLLFFALPASLVCLLLIGANANLDHASARPAVAPRPVTESSPVLTAQVTKGGQFACATEEAFDQIVTASIKGDFLAIGYLIDMSGQCFIPRAGLPVTVLQTRWTGRKQVRLYGDTLTATVWTFTENIVTGPVVTPAISESDATQQAHTTIARLRQQQREDTGALQARTKRLAQKTRELHNR